MNIVLWILQILLGLYFLAVGVMHFVIPPGLPAMMNWMYDLPPWLHWVSGAAEILGGLGLILPSVTRIRPQLTVWAALGLILVMIGAAIYHLTRGEIQNIVGNLFWIVLLAIVAYGRSRMVPIPERA